MKYKDTHIKGNKKCTIAVLDANTEKDEDTYLALRGRYIY